MAPPALGLLEAKKCDICAIIFARNPLDKVPSLDALKRFSPTTANNVKKFLEKFLASGEKDTPINNSLVSLRTC